MLCRPQVALKIKTLTDAIQDASLISLGAHLNELASIRDLAKFTNQLKTALAAERARGEAVGIYQKHDAQNKGKLSGAVNIQINMASPHDVSI
jgi:prefoldin subunit 5